MKKFNAVLFILALGSVINGAETGGKKEMDTSSKIDRVMVYHDRALITRKSIPLSLQQGIYEISFRDLPVLINDDSVRASIGEGADVRILDVEVKTYQLEKSPEARVRELQENLQKLADEKKVIENNVQVLKLEKEFLNDVRKSYFRTDKGPLKNDGTGGGFIKYSEPLKVKDFDVMLNYLNEKFRKNLDDARMEDVGLRGINKRITFLKGELKKFDVSQSSVPRKKLIRVTADVHRGGTYVLEISYINYKIKWEPGYDIRVYYDDKKTEFIGHGIISQNSGEDWINAKISYSTAQPALQGWLPELVPLYATTSARLIRPASGKYGKKFSSQQAMNRAILDNKGIDAMDRQDSGDGLVTDTTASSRGNTQAGSLVFDVLKRSDILSDDSPHRTTISRQSFPVKFEYISIPKLNPHAYLQAIGKNSMGSPILRGNLNIFMGNDFVGSSRTDNILPGEDFELTLSVNENIRVTRTLDEKEIKKPGFLSNNKRTTYTFLIKVENYSNSPITINILDQIPVSNSEDVEIEVEGFSHQPVKREKNGIVKWRLDMRNKETVNLTFGFTVSVPKDRDPAFFMTNTSPALYLQNITQEADEIKLYDMEQKNKGPAMRKMMH